jgi:Uncharacterised nucleotidyltransferase
LTTALTTANAENIWPEKQLLISCARTRLDAAAAAKIRRLVARALDWDFVMRAAAENSVTPLVARHVGAVAAEMAWMTGETGEAGARFGRVATALGRLQEAARANSLRCLLFASELIRIVEALGAEGVAAIPYKGPVLAAQAYGDVSAREFEDLDIIVAQREIAKADRVMTGLGYRARFPGALASPDASTGANAGMCLAGAGGRVGAGAADAGMVPGEYSYRDETRGILVDLHTERTMRHFPKPLELDAAAGESVAARLVSVRVGGQEVRTFGAEDGVVMLCVHGAKDFWERLSWVADVAEFVGATPGMDWDRAMRRAQELGASRMLRVGLALASKVLGARLPEGVMASVRADQTAGRVASRLALRFLSREPRALSASERLKFRREMVSGYFGGWRYVMRLALAPAEEDWAMMRLPGPLAPLYVALRPLRLLRKYGLSGGRVPRAAP